MLDINISENLGLSTCESRDVKVFLAGAGTGLLAYGLVSNKCTIYSYLSEKWFGLKKWVHN